MHQPKRHYITIILSLVLIILGFICIFILSQELSHYKNFLNNLGHTLIGAGILVVLVDRICTNLIVEELKDTLKTFSSQQKLEEFGLKKIYRSAPCNFILDQIRGLKKRDTFIMVQTYYPNSLQIKQALATAIKNEACIKIFLLEPESELAIQRSLDLKPGDTHFVTENIQKNSKDIKNLYHELLTEKNITKKTLNKHLQLYYYKKIPSFSYIAINLHAWIGLLWYEKESNRSFNIEIEMNTACLFSQQVKKHLEILEENATQVNL